MLLLKRTLICACLLASFNGMAAGMVPDTSLLIVNEDKQGASMDVKNTDAEAQLLSFLPLSLSVKKIKLKWCLARTFPSLFTRLAWR